MSTILYDGIIYSLQGSGGISVLFNELITRLPSNIYKMVCFDNGALKPRFLERYRSFHAAAAYELFHSTYYRLPSVRSGRIVTTVHDYTYERYSQGIRKRVHSEQKNKCIAGSDKIICVSESTKRDLLEYSGVHFDSRVVVVHNGVSSDYCKIVDISRRDQVLFVGARSGYKNFSAVVEALSEIDGIELVCVGGGKFNKGELSFLEKNIPHRYCHKGYLSNSQLNLEYNRSLCLVYPSLYEGFGIPILEAMRAGCPVVAVNISSIPEVAGNAAFLMERGGVDEIRIAIEFFCNLNNREKYAKLGLEQAKKFSWDITFNKTLAVYEELLGRKLIGIHQ